MNSIGNNKKGMALLSATFVFVLGFAIFYYVVYPKMQEKDSLQYQISSMKDESKTLQEQLKTLQGNQDSKKKSTTELLTKVPSSRELSKLIDSIEQLESVNHTQVASVDFNNYDAAVKETLKTEEQQGGNSKTEQSEANSSSTENSQTTDSTQSNDQNVNQSNDSANNSEQTEDDDSDIEDTKPVSPIASSSLPDSLKLVTMNLTVDANDKKEIKGFLKEIELLPRIMRIDSVSYATPNTEVTESSTDNKENKLQANIQLTTFYYVGQLDEQKEKK